MDMGRRKEIVSCAECPKREDCLDMRVCKYLGYEAFWR